MLTAMSDKNEATYVPEGGRSEGTCNAGLSKRSPRLKLLRVELESKRDGQQEYM